MDSETRSDGDQRTAVAAMAVNVSKPRRGQVIGERYEIRGKLRNDAFTRGFLAFDQEHEQSVLLRAIRPELLDATVREDVAARLSKVIGIGGSYLPGILDGDLDDPFVYATEPVPEGASIRDVLDRRIATKRPLEPFELLPVVAHLDAALRALPEGARHGDVRAENVWTDTERLQLTGGFLLAAMPGGAVAAVVQRNTGLKRRFAREISIGGGMRSSDYFGVGAIVYESLVLKAPQADGRCDAVDRDLRQVLEPLLTPIPTQRSTSLSDLIEVLARLAGLPIPQLEPAPFHTKRAFPPEERSGDEPSVHDVDTAIAPPLRKMIPAKTSVDHAIPSVDEDDGFAPAPDVNEDDKTQPRASIAKIKDDGLRKRAEAAARAGAAVRAKRRALTEAERRTRAAAAGLDPRLVRAALADDEEGSHHIGAVDTRANPSPPPAIRAEVTRESVPAKKRSASVPPISVPPLAAGLSSRPPPPIAAPRVGGSSDASDKPAPTQPDKLSAPANPDPFDDGLRMALGGERTSEGVPMDPSVPVGAAVEGTQEIGLDELEEHQERELSISSGQVLAADVDFPESEEVPLDPSVPAKPAKGGTQEISFDELDDMERAAGGGDPAPPVMLSDLSGMKREIPPVRGVPAQTAPSDGGPKAGPPITAPPKAGPPKTAPAPVVPALQDPAPTAPPAEPPLDQPSAHAPAAHPPMMGSPAMPNAPAQEPPPPSPQDRLPAQKPPVTHAKTSPDAPKMRRKPAKTMQMKAPRKGGSDQWIIVGALLLGAMIIAGGLFYAAHRREAKLLEQQQRLQERYDRSSSH